MKWHRKTTSYGIWDDEERRIAVIVQDHPDEAVNSRLIAAAPQLLGALRNACLAMTAIRFGAKDCYETAMAECRSAIAAVTGFGASEPPGDDAPTWTIAPGHPDLQEK